MKKFKAMLSMVMVLVLISVSVTPILAENINSNERAIISEDLAAVMEKSKADDKIKVYLWYKDINQDEVDALTTKATGLTPENCAVIEEFPSTELLYSLRNGDAKAETRMDAYLERTKSARNVEQERTEIYSSKHMEISNEMYNQKSQNILNALSISNNDVEFSSQFAPMIIAEMTKGEIEEASKNSDIDEISLYVETEPIEESISSAITTTKVDEINAGTCFGLTGEDVKVGIIENGRPIFQNDGEEELSALIENQRKEGKEIDINTLERITIEQTTPTIVHTDNGGIIRDYGNVAVVEGTSNPSTTHSTAVAKVLLTVSPNIKLYTSNYDYENIETLVSADVKIINISLGSGVLESDPKYAYTDEEKWFDYLISNHGVTVFKSAGNNGGNTTDHVKIINDKRVQCYAPRVTSPGLAYNIISVGQYKDKLSEAYAITEDSLYYSSSYKNSVDGKYGCEKPDVVMPSSFNGGGTSVASPFLAGTIALLCELKPSLLNQPHLIKAIILASCHRKVKQNTEGNELFISGVQEYIEDGITQRQGAGAPDAWTMACIVCQGTYGYGIFTGFEEEINFVQPTYGATGLNVSIAWLRQNIDTNPDVTMNDASDIVAGQVANVDLSTYRNDEVIKTSTLSQSSTEMCYIDELTDDFNYKIKLTQDYPPTSVRYAYAWSTNNMYAPITINQDSVNCIKNASNGKYIALDTEISTQQPVLETVSSQTTFDDTHRWIVETNGDAYNVSAGYGSAKLYLGQSNTVSGSSYTSQLNSVAQSINIKYNDDGTVSFLNSTSDKILSYSGSALLWNSYNNTTDTPTLKQKWHLEKVNFLCGDANMDGALETGGNTEAEEPLPGLDEIFIQNYITNPYELSCLQHFLTDIDKDGDISIMDATMIGQFANEKYI